MIVLSSTGSPSASSYDIARKIRILQLASLPRALRTAVFRLDNLHATVKIDDQTLGMLARQPYAENRTMQNLEHNPSKSGRHSAQPCRAGCPNTNRLNIPLQFQPLKLTASRSGRTALKKLWNLSESSDQMISVSDLVTLSISISASRARLCTAG